MIIDKIIIEVEVVVMIIEEEEETFRICRITINRGSRCAGSDVLVLWCVFILSLFDYSECIRLNREWFECKFFLKKIQGP